jgi:GH35 family endo-1,4-beta-xylanase
MKPTSRRTILQYSAAAAAASLLGSAQAAPKQQEEAAGLGAEDAAAPTTGPGGEQYVRVILHEADDSPLDKDRAELCYARDLADDPLPQAVHRAEGRVRIALPKEPVQIVCRLKVPDFGEVYCYADNGGKGYAKPQNMDFAADAAATRLRRVREAAEKAKSSGVPGDPNVDRHLEAATKPLPKESGKARTAAAYESLSHGLHAGEMLALAVARHRISKLDSPRKEFKFGALVSGFDNEGPKFVEHFKRAFNRATTSWYTWGPEQPPETRVGYQRMEASIAWCEANGIDPKGFGYCYMARGATAEWMRPIEMPDGAGGVKKTPNPRWNFEKIRDEYVKIVRNTAARYHGRVHVMEVLNEAHDKANLWQFNHAQVLEIAKGVCDAARQGSKDVQRMINHCCMWGEYAKKPLADGSRAWSPKRFIADCLSHGVEYDVIGLQLYYPQYDAFEIDRMLDRHTMFGKPIEITENSTSSAPGLDPHSMRPKTSAPGWHGEWSEATQADWLEAVYTLCYSKPAFQGITWWDFSDHRGRFWPFGGILREDQSPKQSYNRLIELQKRWGVAKPA